MASLLPALTPVPLALFPVYVALGIHAAVLPPAPFVLLRDASIVAGAVLLHRILQPMTPTLAHRIRRLRFL